MRKTDDGEQAVTRADIAAAAHGARQMEALALIGVTLAEILIVIRALNDNVTALRLSVQDSNRAAAQR
jgi:hypothetical protein